MYYRGDGFETLEQAPDTPYEYQTGQAQYEGAYPGAPGANPGGFLGQLAGVGKAFGLFFSPFLPVLAPALMSTPVIGAAITAGSKLADFSGGALRIIEGTTTGGTTIAQEATSPASLPPPTPSSTPAPPSLVIYSPNLGPSAGSRRSALVSQLQPGPARRSSRASRASRPLSPAQRKALSREVRALLLQ